MRNVMNLDQWEIWYDNLTPYDEPYFDGNEEDADEEMDEEED